MRRFLILLIACAAGPLAAQTPAERAQLDSIRMRMLAIEDTAALVTLERQRIAVARVDRDNPFIHMQLGWISYRLGLLTTARRRYQDAASEFQWAADLRPAWPYAWYHLGLAELSTGEASVQVVENLRQAMGQDYLSQAVRSFSRAVEADSTFSFALVELAMTAMRQRIGPRLDVASRALRRAAAGPSGRDPLVLVWRARIERRLGEFDSALAAVHAYLAAGGDSMVGGIELARSQAQLGRMDSTRLAYEAALAGSVSIEGRAELRRDLRWIATPAELARFDSLTGDSLRPWVHRFWTLRDAADVRRSGERLMEQLRRYQYAFTNFGLVSRRRGVDPSFVHRDTTQDELDDRGLIYLRHGEPTRRARFAAVGVEGNESWLYRRPGQTDVVMHFVAVNDVQDFRLVESLDRVCRPGFDPTALQAPTMTRSRADNLARSNECFQSREPFGGIYQRLSRPGGASPQDLATERATARSDSREAVASDSYRLTFEDRLDPVVSYFLVADSARAPELHLVFALPASRLHPRETSTGFTYLVALRLVVFDRAGRISRLDTLRAFRTDQRLGAGAFLTEQIALRVPAGDMLYSFVVEEPGAGSGQAVTSQRLDVPSLTGPFAASDVVMGREGSGLVWRRPAGDVALNPLMRFPVGGTAQLYYEIYGLPPDASVGTRVRITRRGGGSIIRRLFGGGSGADLAYTTQTESPDLARVRQRLELTGLGTGRYDLILELTDPVSGARLVRRSPFEVFEP